MATIEKSSSMDDEIRESQRLAVIEVVLKHIRVAMRSRSQSAEDIDIDVEPTTRKCCGTIDNDFADEEPDGGLRITITLPPVGGSARQPEET